MDLRRELRAVTAVSGAVTPRIGALLATVVSTSIAAALRLPNLGRVPGLIFDETYYAKDAWSLRALGYEGKWGAGADALFRLGDTSSLSPSPAFVVHPPLGKWLIALGMIGGNGPEVADWRMPAAVAGTAGVTLLCLLAWTLFRSPWVVLLAGLFLATDGVHLVLSRAALLDIFLSTFCVGALWAVARDQTSASTSWWRPWQVLAGIFLGCAIATKWSGLYLLAALGLFVFLAELLRECRAGHSQWLRTSLFRGALSFLYLVGTSALIYIASWSAWFRNSDAWGRTPGGNLASQWWRYQLDMWNFHVGVTEVHPYMAPPATWIFQLRPTSFWYQFADGKAATILALGNPALWWVGAAALLAMAAAMLFEFRWQYALIWVGIAGLYLPWFLYTDRTVFNFYSVGFAPLIALAAAWALRLLAGRDLFGGRFLLVRRAFALLLSGLILVCAWWFWPVWVGEPLSPDAFHARMWLASWV